MPFTPIIANPPATALTFIDLFAGIGGFRRALQNVGAKCVFSSEIDKYACNTYEANYGDRPSGDVTKIDAKDIPPHDILTAGFPCQAFSIAGKRKGFEDTRGTMFFEIARILEHHKTPAVLLENVKGLLSHDSGETFKTILGILNDLGYQTIEHTVLNTKDFGLPQNRERIFIVAFKNSRVPFNFPVPPKTPIKIADILENEVDPKYYLSAARLKSLVKYSKIGKKEGVMIGRVFGQHSFRPMKDNLSPTLRASMGTGGNNQPMVVRPYMRGVVKSQYTWALDRGHPKSFVADKPKQLTKSTAKIRDRVYSTDHPSPAVLSSMNINVADELGVNPETIRRLTPRECARLQGYPDSFVFPCSASQTYKQLGNSVSVPVVEAIAKNIVAIL